MGCYLLKHRKLRFFVNHHFLDFCFYAYDNYIDVDEDDSVTNSPNKPKNKNSNPPSTEINADDIEIDDDYEGDYEISLDDGEEEYEFEKKPTKEELEIDAANMRWMEPTRKVSLKHNFPLTLIYKVEISDDCSHYYNQESIPYYVEGYTYSVLNQMDKSIRANTTAVVFIGCQIRKYDPKFVFEVEYYVTRLKKCAKSNIFLKSRLIEKGTRMRYDDDDFLNVFFLIFSKIGGLPRC